MQNITASRLDDTNNFMLKCVFVSGSNARGCMIVLVSAFHNTTVNLIREGSCISSTSTVDVTTILSSNICEVFGFDIESDGSIGTIAVPGGLLLNVSLSCSNVYDSTAVSNDDSVPPLSEFVVKICARRCCVC